jgi:hypothetical protein
MNPLAIFTGPYALLAKWGVIALIAAAIGAYGWFKGNEHGTQKLIDYQGKQAIESIKVITRQGVATERVVKQYVDRVKLVEGVTTTIEKEVTRYVEGKPLALACMLDNRWVRLHDAAAAGTLPPAAQADDGAAGAVSAAGALPVVTKNYAVGVRNADKLEFCQNWVREQYKATNGEALGY